MDIRRIVAIAAGLLTGCMVGPDYERPAVDAPAAFQYEPKAATDTANTQCGSSSTTPCSTR